MNPKKYAYMCIALFLLVFCEVSTTDEKSSLTFVIDDTSSMTDDIDQVKRDTNNIFDAVLKSNESQIENFVLLTFNDPTTELRTITKKRDDFKDALSKIYAHNVINNECAEFSMTGIMEGIKKSLPRSTIYVFTDASARDHDIYPQVEDIAMRRQAQVVFVLTGLCDSKSSTDYQVYHKLASATDGQVFHLQSKTDVAPIMNYIIQNLKKRHTTIANVNVAPGTGSVTFYIDSKVVDATITQTGDDVKYTVKGPDGNEVHTTSLVDINGVTSVQITNPEIGTYVIYVRSPYGAHVVVAVTSTVKFEHGFTTIKPTSMGETISRPLPDVKSFITIELTEGELDLKMVQILTIHDKQDHLEKNLSLAVLDKDKKLYITELEDFPTTRFRLAIVGFDPETNTNITRVGPPIDPLPLTPVIPLEDIAPKVEILGKASTIIAPFDKPIQLKCRVEGYPKPDIIWVNMDNGNTLTNTIRILEPPDVFISTLDIEKVDSNTTYACKAVNRAGSDSKTITAATPKPYLTFLTKTQDKYIDYHKADEINCKVDAYPPATITWYKGTKPLLKKDNIVLSDDNTVLKILEMRPVDDGNYICEARNDKFRDWRTAKITIIGIDAPVIDRNTSHIEVLQGSDVAIDCKLLKGRPRPKITWWYKKADDEKKERPEWNNEESIILHSVTTKNAGEYSCKAENEIDTDSHSVQLIVEFPPQITSDVTNKLVKDGYKVILPCNVKAKPNAQAQWFKDGVLLNKTKNIHFYNDHGIKIKKASINDIGNYTCRATNKLGNDSRVHRVDVYVPITITIPDTTKFDVNVGTTVSLPCTAKGYPSPHIQWIYHSFDRSIQPKPLKTNETTLRLKYIQLDEAGYYTCEVSNAVDRSNITYEINVYAAPHIVNIYLEKKFRAVEGDLVTMIKCKATGHPPPEILWMNENHEFIASGDHFSVEDGTLIIKNIKKDDQGTYICIANNGLASDSEVYEVDVDKYPQPSLTKTTQVIEEGKSISLKCDVPHRRTDLLRWYKNGKFLQNGELIFSTAQTSNNGIYTCRVSDFAKSITGNTVEVAVGRKPVFVEDPEEIVFVEGGWADLSCEANGYPEPKVNWWHNNQLMNVTDFYQQFIMELDTQGVYICQVYNDFGPIVRSFNITTKDCFIDLSKKPSKLQPLLVFYNGRTFEWPQNNVKNGLMAINKNDYLYFYCPSGFKGFPNQYFERAVCNGGSTFNIRGQKYDFSDISCLEEVTYNVRRTNNSCYDGNTELIQILYSVLSKPLEAYNVCLDKDNNRPLFTVHTMKDSVADVDYLHTEWADYEELYLNFDEAYDCRRQNRATSRQLRRGFHSYDGCCFGKRQLVSPKDLPPGVAQKAAFNALNVVPHWSTCTSKSNWDDVEQRVRNLAKSSYSDLLVWTGTSENLQLTGYNRRPSNISLIDKHKYNQAVPLFLWKVVQNPAENSSLAIIQVNMPDLTPSEAADFVRCRDVCQDTEWMKGSWHDTARGYTYCCTLVDFEDSFNFQGVFEPHDKLLKQVYRVPSYSVL